MRVMKHVWVSMVLLVMAVAAQAADLPDFTRLVEDNNKAVVNISASTKAKQRVSAGAGQQDIPEIFRRFLGEGFEFNQPQQDKQSFGSGFIISADGYVLTNNHVVSDTDKVVVRLSDRRELEAEVVGTDARADIALLKVSAKDLPVVKIGVPEKLKVGEWVVAIGSPFGFDYSVTSGIVSAKSRALPNESYVPFIQTDVAINPGNSGGPLFNLAGEVVGINSQIYSRSGGFMGLSFAIPIDVAMEVVEQLKKNGKVERGYLGVVIQDVTKELADLYGLSKPQGALVAKVLPESPAEKAGLREGDVITHFAGKEVVLSSELPQLIGRAHVGSKQPLVVMREGKAKTLEFEIGALPADQDENGAPAKGSAKPDINRLGISIRDLTEQERQALKVSGGILVTQVTDGAAAEAGVRPGDVIIRLNRKDVVSVKSFVETARSLPVGKPVELVINRRGMPVIRPLTLDK